MQSGIAKGPDPFGSGPSAIPDCYRNRCAVAVDGIAPRVRFAPFAAASRSELQVRHIRNRVPVGAVALAVVVAKSDSLVLASHP